MMRIDIMSRNDADVVGVRNGCTFTGWTGRYWIKKCALLWRHVTWKQVGCIKDKRGSYIKRKKEKERKIFLATLSTYLHAPNLLSMSWAPWCFSAYNGDTFTVTAGPGLKDRWTMFLLFFINLLCLFWAGLSQINCCIFFVNHIFRWIVFSQSPLYKKFDESILSIQCNCRE